MMKTNYHTHCYLDDGSESMESYVKTAIERSFYALGFSCHAPMEGNHHWLMNHEDFPTYRSEITRLSQAYDGLLELYCGLELDYLDDEKTLTGSEYLSELDYTIASVHMFRDQHTGEFLSVDGPIEEFISLLEHNFSGDIKSFVKTYYRSVISLIETFSFDILGHCDIIKKRNAGNRFFDPQESWYQNHAFDMLDAAAQRGVRLEVNTGGIARGVTEDTYPSEEMLKRCRELHIPVVITADAHKPDDLDCCFEQSYRLLKDIGYTHQDVFLGGAWKTIPIDGF